MTAASRFGESAAAPLEVFLVAGEESGDRLGAALMQALRARTSGHVRFRGVGGHDMVGQGLANLFPIDDLAIMGFTAVPRRLPAILRRIREAADAVIATRPDILVIIDSPDFTHRVAKRVRAAAPSIPIVNYVPPSVWAWRPWRARSMRRHVDLALALLPFEPAAHRELGGPPCVYVGHPLVEAVAQLRPDAEAAARRRADPPLVLVLPGSRSGEIRRLAVVFGEAIGRLRDRVGPIELILPTVPRMVDAVTAAAAAWPVEPRIVVETIDKHAAFRNARIALAKSGTVTLELALAGVPMVTAYKASALEAFIVRRMIRTHSAILPNLVLGENVVPEFLQEDCTAERLAEALLPLMTDGPGRRRQIEAFSRLDAIMEIGSIAPATRAADAVLETIGRSPNGGDLPFAAPDPKRYVPPAQ